ncbi:MAG: DUF3857 domain-containing transglutaminase family protein [Chthonomonadales bacterium]|nr:DUF3857 domain-containing transglutaminase family protein [Chthonomonadales bacterium]
MRPLAARALARATLATLLACTVAAHAAGQKPGAASPPSATFPAVVDAALKDAMRRAPAASKYPNSGYARLLDLATVTVRPDGTTVTDTYEANKLYNERGRGAAEVDIPFNASYGRVEVLSAFTIRKDGRIVPVRRADVRVGSRYSDYPLYDDTKAVGFSMPAVEDGCVIVHRVREVTRPILPGHFWTRWAFSSREPAVVSRLTLRAPADKPVRAQVLNDPGVKPSVTLSPDGRARTWVWEMRDLPPVEVEPSMPEATEVTRWLEVTSLDSWQQVAAWFWGLAKPRFAANGALRAAAEKLIAGKATPEEKAKAIYDWVATRVRYVGLEFGLSAFQPHAASEVHAKLYGDCKDKAGLLIAMLGVAGIAAHPVLLSAGERFPMHTLLPSPATFDHCIAVAEVGGKPVWLDPTSEVCAYGDIPDSDRGADALVVRDGQAEWRTVPDWTALDNRIEFRTKVTLSADGSADVHAEARFLGESGQGMRAYMRQLSPDQRRQVAQGLAQAFAGGTTLTDSSVPDGMDREGPFVLRFSLRTTAWARKVGKLLLVPLRTGAAGSSQRHPYVKEERVWPVVLPSAAGQSTETVFTLPEGYEVEEAPRDVRLDGPLNSAERRTVRGADGRTVTITSLSTQEAGRVPVADYPKLKAFYDEVLRLTEDQLVLRQPGSAAP